MNISRRKLITTAAYVAPAVLTIKAIPSFASTGSARPSDRFGSPTGSGSGGFGSASDSGTGSFGSTSDSGTGGDLFMTQGSKK